MFRFLRRGFSMPENTDRKNEKSAGNECFMLHCRQVCAIINYAEISSGPYALCMLSRVFIFLCFAGVMELADVVDSKSTGSDTVPVRVRPPAPCRSKRYKACSDFFYKSQGTFMRLLLFKPKQFYWIVI
jgi:hypothetical protein